MSNRKKPSNPNPLRAALQQKTALRTYFDMAVTDTETAEEAQRMLVVAQQIQASTLLTDDEAVKERAQHLVEQAKEKVAECFHRIWFQGLQYDAFDALVALHPPTDEQAADQWAWNPDTFNYALLEACIVDGDLTADEWEAELATDRWTHGDKSRLIGMCVAANRQTLADAVPKD